MQGSQTIKRKVYWPFSRYDDWGWWNHPCCKPPSLMWMAKPSDEEEEEELRDYSNVLEQLIKFATRFKRN
jgi:hypothetical protein